MPIDPLLLPSQFLWTLVGMTMLLWWFAAD